MTYFARLASVKTVCRRRGHAIELTAKLAGNRIVFAGGSGQQSIEADADIRLINAYWKLYYAANNGGTVANLPQIERTTIDAARGK